MDEMVDTLCQTDLVNTRNRLMPLQFEKTPSQRSLPVQAVPRPCHSECTAFLVLRCQGSTRMYDCE